MSRMSLVSEAAKAMMAAAGEPARVGAAPAPPQASPAPPPPDPSAAVALRLAQIAIRAALSAALGAIFPLVALGSALFLWNSVLAAPTTRQLVGLGLYGLLLLALEGLRRRGASSTRA